MAADVNPPVAIELKAAAETAWNRRTEGDLNAGIKSPARNVSVSLVMSKACRPKLGFQIGGSQADIVTQTTWICAKFFF